MVSIESIQEQRNFYLDNIETWIKEHPGKYVLIEDGSFGKFRCRFFKNESELEGAVAEYKGILGPTILAEQIPPKMTGDLRGQIGLYKFLKEAQTKRLK